LVGKSALRKYREWQKKHLEKGDYQKLINEKLKVENIPDTIAFYPAIRILHIFLVGLMVVISLAVWYTNQTFLATVQIATILGAASIFSYYVGLPLRPAKIQASIEESRAKLLCVFDEYCPQKKLIKS
jgi:hypothetical protein